MLGVRRLRVQETRGVFVTSHASRPCHDESLLSGQRLQKSQRIELERRLEEKLDVVETGDVGAQLIQKATDCLKRSHRPLLDRQFEQALGELEAEVDERPTAFLGGIAQD